jgi:hypothetical protein
MFEASLFISVPRGQLYIIVVDVIQEETIASYYILACSEAQSFSREDENGRFCVIFIKITVSVKFIFTGVIKAS